MNKVLLFGNVGQDPAIRLLDGGKKIAKFSLATSKRGKEREGNRTNQSTWHNIIMWDKLAELAEKHVKKGSPLIIEGEISYRSYEDKDGVTKYITEIVAREMHFAGQKKDDSVKTQLDLASETAEFHNEINEPEKDGLSDLPF